MHRFLTAMFAIVCLPIAALADVNSDAEMFGALPRFSNIVISPDGRLIALLQENGTDGAVYVKNLETGEDVTARKSPKAYRLSARFVDNRYLLVDRHFYRFRKLDGTISAVPYSETQIYDLERNKTYGFLEKNRTVNAHPFTPRRIVGPSPKPGHVYATAYGSGPSGGQSFNLYEVKLSNGRGKLVRRGDENMTPTFLPSPDGQLVVQEDHAIQPRMYRISVHDDDSTHKMLESTALGLKSLDPQGFDQAGEKLFYPVVTGENLTRTILSVSVDDTLDLINFGSPVFHKSDVDVSHTLTDFQNVVSGVRFSGLKPSYDFFDDAVDKALDDLAEQLPDLAITVKSWSKNLDKIVLHMAGAGEAGAFYLLDVPNSSMKRLSSQYPDIPGEKVGQTLQLTYTARDGLEIPALLTRPVGGADSDAPLPLVVLPHGGPEAHDELKFDYWAQFLANQGYLVLQPNFRGSDGFGQTFSEAGYGEWGRLMQDDITDGVKHLIDTGVADADKVCIMGGSYGGYAALAGGAFTPDLYACVIAFAPVADLEKMLEYERDYGRRRNNFTFAYWQKAIGHIRRRDELFAASPVFHADDFQAPVMLVHGNFDWVVPQDQSADMERALKDAGKDVEYYTQLAGDHYLTQRQHRVDALKLFCEFLARHLAPPAAETD